LKWPDIPQLPLAKLFTVTDITGVSALSFPKGDYMWREFPLKSKNTIHAIRKESESLSFFGLAMYVLLSTDGSSLLVITPFHINGTTISVSKYLGKEYCYVVKDASTADIISIDTYIGSSSWQSVWFSAYWKSYITNEQVLSVVTSLNRPVYLWKRVFTSSDIDHLIEDNSIGRVLSINVYPFDVYDNIDVICAGGGDVPRVLAYKERDVAQYD
jgi:hypothetical protein